MDIKLYGCTRLEEKALNTVEKIINDYSKLKWGDAVIHPDNTSLVRHCKTCFLNYYQELDNLFGILVEDFNRNHSGWNYDIECMESIQLTHYFEHDFYDWHVDKLPKHIIKNDVSYNRKISATVWLNDPEEYEGGEFDIEIKGPREDIRYDTLKSPKGSIVIFPSDNWHRVRPVTSGVRKSLVIWFQGPSFR